METIAKFLVSAIELVEAELRSLQRGITKLGLRLVAVIAAGFLGFIAIIMLFMAAYLLLARTLGDIAALAMIGAIFAGIAIGLIGWALQKSKPAPSIRNEVAGPPEAFGAGTVPPVSASRAGGLDEATIRIAS